MLALKITIVVGVFIIVATVFSAISGVFTVLSVALNTIFLLVGMIVTIAITVALFPMSESMSVISHYATEHLAIA